MNEIQRATMAECADLVDEMHHADVVVRVRGEDCRFEADWLRQVLTTYYLLEQIAEMNGEAFWHTIGRLPVSKFVGPLRHALETP